MGVIRAAFGATDDGVTIDEYTLTSARGLTARVMTYGGILVGLEAPDRDGRLADVTLGFDTLAPYLAGHPYFGALVGRFANRIAGGVFSLDGTPYQLAANNDPNHLHGGARGFDKRVWSAEPIGASDVPGVTLRFRSPDGDEGYPGTLDVAVTCTLIDAALRLDYTATTDRATVLNLSNHTYFNLAGGGDILGHEVTLHAARFLPVDATLIPTGELRPVRGTPMDFTTPTAIGARLPSADEQVQRAHGGYDHCWVLDAGGSALALAARVREPVSGRVLEVWTTQPGVQFYTGNFLDGSLTGRDGRAYGRHAGFCLETQHFPDSPNQSTFPSTILRPGDTYRQTTEFRFSVD
ncbi:MAG: galactose mutarotase [Chloroflexi bacterium]|nr:galactose mutarotase [Chloroflexota bacterium]